LVNQLALPLNWMRQRMKESQRVERKPNDLPTSIEEFEGTIVNFAWKQRLKSNNIGLSSSVHCNVLSWDWHHNYKKKRELENWATVHGAKWRHTLGHWTEVRCWLSSDRQYQQHPKP
jgi:hypothetical protein